MPLLPIAKISNSIRNNNTDESVKLVQLHIILGKYDIYLSFSAEVICNTFKYKQIPEIPNTSINKHVLT